MSDRSTMTLVQGALIGSAAMAAAKLASAPVIGSAALLAEGLHALAAMGSQGLLMAGLLRGRRGPDGGLKVAPHGELVFWSLVTMLLAYPLAAGIAIYDGIDRLGESREAIDASAGLVVLASAIVLQAVVHRAASRLRGPPGAHRHGIGDPVAFAIALQCRAGIAGGLVALAGLAAAGFLGATSADALAAIGSGLVMGTLAALAALETRHALLQGAGPAGLIAGPGRPAVSVPGADEAQSSGRSAGTAGGGAAETGTHGLIETEAAGRAADIPPARKAAPEPPRKSYPPPHGKGSKRRR